MSASEVLYKFMEKVAQIQDLPQKLEQFEDSFALKKYRLSEITISEGVTLHQNIVKKFYKYYGLHESGIWFENELRLFVWLLLCYMQSYKKHIRQLTAADWLFFSQVLYVKQPCLFEYQAKIILDYSLCLKKWSQEQDSLLTKTVLEAKRIKWNQIAKALFSASNKMNIRTSKQCRERWLNHLDPCKTKHSWTLQECEVLIEAVQEKGKKWASLVQVLKGRRSEHSIKNKYNSILVRFSKNHPELTEKQNCVMLLGRISFLLSGGEVDQNDENVFGDSVKGLKQNQNLSDDNIMTKSNASLERTVDQNENRQTLDFCDFVEEENMPLMLSNQNYSSVELKKKSSRKMSDANKQNFTFDCMFLQEDSMLGLQELKLNIRESELDR